MRALTSQEKRTIRFGAAAVALYLVLFGGAQVWSYFGKKHAEYLKLVKEV